MELKDYLHYYFGCNFLFDNKQWQMFRIEMTNKGVLVTGKRFFATGGWRHNTIWAADCKLVLRRLEDMTEGEMVGLLQSMVPSDMEDKPTDEDYDLEMFYNDDGLMVDGDIAVGANFTCGCFDGQIAVKKCGSIIQFDENKDVTRDMLINAPLAFHYLLQQHFDIFGLIDAGLAVDIKIINQ